MTSIKVSPISEDVPYGSRVTGVNWDTVQDADVRKQLLDVFEDRGLIVFSGVERTTEMQIAISDVFGPPLNHPLAAIRRVAGEKTPGVIDIYVHPDDASVVELDGRQLSCWAPWHFDNAYTKALCRAAVLRALEIPPEGGMTGFADGIQLYRDISPQLRARFEKLKIIYDANLLLSNLRFGMPKGWRFLSINPDGMKLLQTTANSPRAVHPAIWRRKSGESVLHVGVQNAAGIHGHENPEGDALLEALLQEIKVKMIPYWHRYEPMDMVIFDNWRFVHCISGNDPKYTRRMHRTTIDGDYGLGRFESELAGGEATSAVQ